MDHTRSKRDVFDCSDIGSGKEAQCCSDQRLGIEDVGCLRSMDLQRWQVYNRSCRNLWSDHTRSKQDEFDCVDIGSGKMRSTMLFGSAACDRGPLLLTINGIPFLLASTDSIWPMLATKTIENNTNIIANDGFIMLMILFQQTVR